ncbi:MAG: hypothetical protein R3264_19610, partial [Anaerolineae bacterium]|nr:hypothetical protein [Anaerolineae bacterium]
VIVIDANTGSEISRFAGEQPAWSPDSNELIIKSCLPDCGLWRVGVDGGGARIVTRDSSDSYPSWSPVDDSIVFTSRRTGDWELYRLFFGSENPIQLTDRSGSDTPPVFSPDGLEIYLRTDAFGAWRVMAISAADGSQERLVQDDVGVSNDWGLARPAVK